MGHPGQKCTLCSKPGAAVVQTCHACRGRVCEKHVVWDSDAGDWLCKRDARVRAKERVHS